MAHMSIEERMAARQNGYSSFSRLFGRRNVNSADNFNYNIRKSYFSDGSQAAADDEEQKKGRRGSIFGNLTDSLFGN